MGTKMSVRLYASMDDAAGSRQVEPPIDPQQLLIQGSDKQYPLRWGCTAEGDRYLAYQSPPVPVPESTIEGFVGTKDGEQRVADLALAHAYDETTVSRQKRLRGTRRFLHPIGKDLMRELGCLGATLRKTPKLERYQVGRLELPADQKLSWGIAGDLVVVGFWVTLMVAGIAAELIVGHFNVGRTKDDEMVGAVAWALAYLPFVGTFATLKWLHPADIEREGSIFYRSLIWSAIVIPLLGMFLFAGKLEALIEFDVLDPAAKTGPSYTWVVWILQISFAIAIYLISLKLGHAWYQLLGYDVRKPRECIEYRADVSANEDSLRSIIEIDARIDGALAAIEARATRAVQDFKCHYFQAVNKASQGRERAEAAANAAAAQARLQGMLPPTADGE
jgi:hypothetical protein